MTREPLMCTTSLDESLGSLEELAARVQELGRAYVRYSEGPERDVEESVDTESGLTLPGLSVNPLHPEEWWTRPIEDWLARQVCQYQELQEKNPDRFAWVLRGIEVGRGPDCEPLLRGVVPIARLDERLLDEAAARYEERFEAGKGPED
ncbi:DUF6098 family protein [Microbacterium immunditiarum]|uniref:Uncharacterized protein n=1 Tax=Microbacterium immunditiarum TaxID=337480 RepID=A0A7Y9GMC3_9MICO|nr:DUF6098 family protein [Microbacterium immunditiarum]NYE19129.1 hypothetical protein [Microbacterium immunditiarum]